MKFMVDNIETFQTVHKNALSLISEMTTKEKDYYLRSCNQCIKRDQDLESKETKLGSVCNKVRKYINTLIEELQIQSIEANG